MNERDEQPDLTAPHIQKHHQSRWREEEKMNPARIIRRFAADYEEKPVTGN